MASTSQPLSESAYSPDTCMFCSQSLRITTSAADTDSESERPLERGEPTTVIDDVELHCGPPGSVPGGHHAHWACLIDHATAQARARAHGAVPPVPADPVLGAAVRDTGTETEARTYPPAFTTCVVCRQNILDPSGRFIVDVRNEGGETRGFDFGVIIEEEEFLDSHPSQVHSRAFHDLVAEGDYVGAIDVIAEHDVDVNCTYGNDGLTALQKAMYSGDASGVEFLRSLGATV
ncbi:hypothetical protein EV363DRAFT_1379591 [Boletus edulis]|nr:hypothetical protein EV363DRAFT_1386476 [Boletus edulis]KAF8119784.1 hypothetical protein EV363DRAFT_1379591 [Boletus edulis]